tara:strand:- start:5583 stop:6245 length:663 start_codon:yes stop_codon:yes gene_type:complete
MNQYLATETLSSEDIEYIYRLIDQFGDWQDGRISYKGSRENKINQQLKLNDSVKHQLSDVVFSNVDKSDKFYNFTAAKSSETPMITRTNVGGFYRPHHDSPDLGDYSTTIFLNDNFEGGELCLWINGEEKKFKPPVGSSVTYRTGTPHRVNEVTKGHRDVIVFWTHSRIKDPFMMEIYQGLSLALDSIDETTYHTLYDTATCPHFILQSLRDSILRKSSN